MLLSGSTLLELVRRSQVNITVRPLLATKVIIAHGYTVLEL